MACHTSLAFVHHRPMKCSVHELERRWLHGCRGAGRPPTREDRSALSSPAARSPLTPWLSRPRPQQIHKLSPNRKEAVKQLVGQYDAVLVFLKSHGCLLNAVKPEMLLDFEDFCRWAGKRCTGGSATGSRT
jgi:hypothetical protein